MVSLVHPSVGSSTTKLAHQLAMMRVGSTISGGTAFMVFHVILEWFALIFSDLRMNPAKCGEYVSALSRHETQAAFAGRELEYLNEKASAKVAECEKGIELLDGKASDLARLTGGAGFVATLLPKTFENAWSPDIWFIGGIVCVIASTLCCIAVLRPTVRSASTKLSVLIDSIESGSLEVVEGLAPTAMLCQIESLTYVAGAKARLLTRAYKLMAIGMTLVLVSVAT